MPISPTHPTTQSLAAAIALAEGYNVAGSIPNTTNNPGDLKNGKSVTELFRMGLRRSILPQRQE